MSYYSAHLIMKSKYIHRKIKLRVYKTTIKPVLYYWVFSSNFYTKKVLYDNPEVFKVIKLRKLQWTDHV